MKGAEDSGSNHVASALPLGCYSLIPQVIPGCHCHLAGGERQQGSEFFHFYSFPAERLKRTEWLCSSHSGQEFCVAITLYGVDLFQRTEDCLYCLYPINRCY